LEKIPKETTLGQRTLFKIVTFGDSALARGPLDRPAQERKIFSGKEKI
jgi:hypothetical protein